MADVGKDPVCRHCGHPVQTNRENDSVFEGMHYVCFHYEFEHRAANPETDRDEDCGLAGCPSAPAVRHKDRLMAVVRELLTDWSNGPPANWDNQTVPDYLGALVVWLQDCERYYGSRGRPIPWDGWQVLADGMRAATANE